MRIVSKQLIDSIELIELSGSLTGHGAIELQEFLYQALDEGRYYFINDMHQITAIDGIGISTIEKFVKRGMGIKLINVSPEIYTILTISNNKDILSLVCNEKNIMSIFALLKSEIEMKQKIKEIKNRCFKRKEASLFLEFTYNDGLNNEISGKALITNLSEAGVFIEQIVIHNAKREEQNIHMKLEGMELKNIRFQLNRSKENINTIGKCIREIKEMNNHCAAIRFIDLNTQQKDSIRLYISHSDYNNFKNKTINCIMPQVGNFLVWVFASICILNHTFL
ncbi:MAG: STAS domain-containing protein [Candidatus Kuenenia sp.]|nr:STAS domain-containing protein [Candidatus Kuenenia hertensis]